MFIFCNTHLLGICCISLFKHTFFSSSLSTLSLLSLFSLFCYFSLVLSLAIRIFATHLHLLSYFKNTFVKRGEKNEENKETTGMREKSRKRILEKIEYVERDATNSLIKGYYGKWVLKFNSLGISSIVLKFRGYKFNQGQHRQVFVQFTLFSLAHKQVETSK